MVGLRSKVMPERLAGAGLLNYILSPRHGKLNGRRPDGGNNAGVLQPHTPD